ncbi:glycine cleavage system aminomethyltransferase GcvT [Derxia lacustris]|uniref:glycine cleavage system aminomethyltransferase GcvT n=1 Tax=Derxia lacustris TaxID=764842 RepID=UPI000A16D602|nr:glycine cleavage system aminomethyltransferase GcvT [Derxia lacustris]
MTDASRPLRRTPLFDAHRAAGARLVDFGGWEMPLHYGSQIDEHHAVRRAAGMFDVSHMCVVDLAGEASLPFLRRLLANDVAKLATPGKALYSCMLDATGGVIDDLIVYFRAPGRYRLVVNAGTAGGDVAWIAAASEAFGLPVSIAVRRDLALIAVQGPQARAAVWAALPVLRAATEPLGAFFGVAVDGAGAVVLGDGELFVGRTGYTGEDGFELILPAERAAAVWTALAAQGVAPAGLGARDTLRLEAGMNLYGNDMDRSVSPLDAGLGWTVDRKTERDFTGRAALDAAGQRHAFLGLVMTERGVLRAHQRVTTAAGDGEITSGTFSPTLGYSVALARLPLGVQPGDAVTVDIRGKAHAARVVKLPFVRHGQALV